MSAPRPTVLLVDDEARTLDLLGAVLEHQGLATTLAKSPQDAIRLLRTIEFDAVVTDVVFDGFAEGSLVLAAARDLQPRAVVVLMTGFPDVEAAVAAMKAGAVDYLKKPVDPIVLAAFAELHRRRPDVELWTFGQGGDLGVDFPHRNLGVLADADLPALYAQATAGLVLSMTNYSLVAQEMLACGLPCVELDSPSVVAAFGSGGAALLAPLDPGGVADALERLLSDPALRAGHAAAGARLREERTWAHAAEQVEAGLRAAIAHTQSA